MSNVAPREGAWIEISRSRAKTTSARVAPREGAWIEMRMRKENL